MKKIQLNKKLRVSVTRYHNQNWAFIYKKSLGIVIPLPTGVTVDCASSELTVPFNKSLAAGTTCLNKIKKITECNFSFSTSVNAEGVAFKVVKVKNAFCFHLGYSHQTLWHPNERVVKATITAKGLKIQSKNPQAVGETCSFLSELRKPSAYGNKGVFILTKKQIFKRAQFKKLGKNKTKNL